MCKLRIHIALCLRPAAPAFAEGFGGRQSIYNGPQKRNKSKDCKRKDKSRSKISGAVGHKHGTGTLYEPTRWAPVMKTGPLPDVRRKVTGISDEKFKSKIHCRHTK